MIHTKLSKIQKMIIQELSVPQPQYLISQKISKQLSNARRQWNCKTRTRREKSHHDVQTESFKASLSRSLKRLQQRGLIQRYSSCHERYMDHLKLTDEGYFVLESLNQK